METPALACASPHGGSMLCLDQAPPAARNTLREMGPEWAPNPARCGNPQCFPRQPLLSSSRLVQRRQPAPNPRPVDAEVAAADEAARVDGEGRLARARRE